jgi:hypothetical protein
MLHVYVLIYSVRTCSDNWGLEEGKYMQKYVAKNCLCGSKTYISQLTYTTWGNTVPLLHSVSDNDRFIAKRGCLVWRLMYHLPLFVCFEYFSFYSHTIFFRSVLRGVDIRRNIPVTSGKERNPTVDEMCAEYFNRLLEDEWKRRSVLFGNVPSIFSFNLNHI